MTTPNGLAWGPLLRVGLHRLGLRPCEFWALTPAELQMMLGVEAGEKPMLRNGLAALMDAYPDKTKEGGSDGF